MNNNTGGKQKAKVSNFNKWSKQGILLLLLLSQLFFAAAAPGVNADAELLKESSTRAASSAAGTDNATAVPASGSRNDETIRDKASPQHDPSLQDDAAAHLQDGAVLHNDDVRQHSASTQPHTQIQTQTLTPAAGTNGSANTGALSFKSPTAGVPKSAPATGRYLISLTLGLLAIVGLIFALAWLVKRMGQGSFVNNHHLKMLAVMPLGTRERLVIVQAGEQQLLLGITASQINTLHVFPEPVIKPDDKAQSDFGKKIFAILQKNNYSPSDQRRTTMLDNPEQS